MELKSLADVLFYMKRCRENSISPEFQDECIVIIAEDLKFLKDELIKKPKEILRPEFMHSACDPSPQRGYCKSKPKKKVIPVNENKKV